MSAQNITGTETIRVGETVDVSEKMIINARCDANQLVPFKYKWAWDKYKQAAPTTDA